jgi:hypothetical protein
MSDYGSADGHQPVHFHALCLQEALSFEASLTCFTPKRSAAEVTDGATP